MPPKTEISQPPGMPEFHLPEALQAEYSNLVRISHSPAEMVLDFSRILPGMTQAEIVPRILMTPVSAKLLFRALGDNLARYESAFGEIALPGGSSLAMHLFKNPPSPEPPEKE